MDILLDPTIWAGLATLVVLEIVLGIDNLIFIAILSDKLPPEQRQRARITGLTLALGMRIILLFSISWLTTLTEPLFHVLGHPFSGRDIIMLIGGAFLLFKGTVELHEKLEGHVARKPGIQHYATFNAVIAQIVVLDAVFSLDAVITAVGMSSHLWVMVTAVCIAMLLMILASQRLMNFVSAHPTVVVLCLGFLLMIGFSLILEGLGFHVPKGYLYAAIGFSILIEAANQLAQRNRRKTYQGMDARTRVAQAVLGLLGSRQTNEGITSEMSGIAPKEEEQDTFKPQERQIMQRVLQLSAQNARAIMTPRQELYWIDLESPRETLEKDIRDCPYATMVVARDGKLDEPLGIILKKDLADYMLAQQPLWDIAVLVRQPLVVNESMNVLQTLEALQKSGIHLAFVVDEFGSLEGLLTLTDVLEAIVGELPEAHEANNFHHTDDGAGHMDVNGILTIPDLRELLGQELELPAGDYSTVAGLVLNILRRIPQVGDTFVLPGWKGRVEEMDGRRISRISFEKQANELPGL